MVLKIGTNGPQQKGVETKLRPEHFGKLESLYGPGKTNKLYIEIFQNSFTLQAI